MSRIQLWIASLVLIGVIKSITAQNSPAHVPHPVVGAKPGFTTNFTCQSHGIPISTCLWERVSTSPNKPSLLVNFNPSNANPDKSPVPGYSYIGAGLEKGECGIVINVVKEEDNGRWQCTLFSNSGLYRGTVDLGILRKPSPPRFSPDKLVGLIDAGSEHKYPSVNLTCYSANGQPTPKFQWFLGEEQFTDDLGPIQFKDDQSGVYTFQELKHRFTSADNGKKLRCVVVHDALTDSDPNEISIDIDIQFAPRSYRDGGNRVQTYADLGTDTMLAINVSSNPRPTQTFWEIDGKQIREGETHERYHAFSLREVDKDVWEVRLKITGVEEDDINKPFVLTVQNPQGKSTFDLQVAAANPGSGGLSAGGIVGLVLGIPAFLILIAVIVVYTRARGLLCFKGDDGTSSEKERMDGDSNGAVDEKPTRRLSSRLSALYENLLAKKKDKTAPVDEEANKEKDKEKEANDSGASPIVIADDKKPEDIVYAELDLARGNADGGNSQVVVRCADDKTEYAEIIGVVPQTLNVDETSPKKSPVGSHSPSPKK